MNTEKLDQALDQIGYQAALDWAPFRAASLRGVLISIVAQPSVEERKADREAVRSLSHSAATILKTLPALSASIRDVIDGPVRSSRMDSDALVDLEAVLRRLAPGFSYAIEVTEGEARNPNRPPAARELRVIEACAEIFILAHNRRPGWGKDQYGKPTGPFTKGVAFVFEALAIDCKSVVAHCGTVCRKIGPEEIAAIRRHGVLQRQLRDKTQ